MSPSVLAEEEETQCNCLAVLVLYKSASLSFVIAFRKDITKLINHKSVRGVQENKCNLHAGYPKPYSLVSGGRGYQVSRGRELN